MTRYWNMTRLKSFPKGMFFLWSGAGIPGFQSQVPFRHSVLSGYTDTSEDSYKSQVKRIEEHSGKRAFEGKRELGKEASLESKAA